MIYEPPLSNKFPDICAINDEENIIFINKNILTNRLKKIQKLYPTYKVQVTAKVI